MFEKEKSNEWMWKPENEREAERLRYWEIEWIRNWDKLRERERLSKKRMGNKMIERIRKKRDKKAWKFEWLREWKNEKQGDWKTGEERDSENKENVVHILNNCSSKSSAIHKIKFQSRNHIQFPITTSEPNWKKNLNKRIHFLFGPDQKQEKKEKLFPQ